MTPEPEKPKKPIPVKFVYSVPKILQLRKILAEPLLLEFKNQVLDKEKFKRVVEILHDGLSSPSIKADTVRESVRYLAGTMLKEQAITDCCHRLAGNLHYLRRHMPARPWTSQLFSEWVPLQVVQARRVRGSKGIEAVLKFKVMGGSPCPQIIVERWSLRKCRFIASKLGFTRPVVREGRALYPYTYPEELVSMRFSGLLTPESCSSELKTEAKGGFRVPPSFKEWNENQLKRRARIGFRCVAGLPPTVPCYHCTVGYTVCMAATHAQNYIKKPCPVCKQDSTFWDPELTVKMCVRCQTESLYTK